MGNKTSLGKKFRQFSLLTFCPKIKLFQVISDSIQRPGLSTARKFFKERNVSTMKLNVM